MTTLSTIIKMLLGTNSLRFSPSTGIPSLTDQVILITGANSGLGYQSALELARHQPAALWLTARDPAKSEAAATSIRALVPGANIHILTLDLSSLSSVRAAAAAFLSAGRRLDVLLLNAGIMAAQPGLTPDGHEVQFETNFLGHALLAHLLVPAATASPSTRVVAVSSHGHVYAAQEGIRLDGLGVADGGGLGAFERYGQSKLAMLLWARQAAKVWGPRVNTAAVHPGMVRTNLLASADGATGLVKGVLEAARKMHLIKSVEAGVRNQLWAAVGEGVESGEYYEPVGVKGLGSKLGRDDGLAERLWVWVEGELKAWIEKRL